jgi:hypothetical protein
MMARKTLLTEAEIRRFMKLAKLGALGEKKLEGLYTAGGRDEEEGALERELGAEDSEADRERDEIGDLEGELDAEPAPEDLELDADVEVEGAAMISLPDFVDALKQAVEEVTGEPTTADLDTGDEEAPLEGGEELDVDMSLEEPGPAEPGGLDVGAVEDEAEFSMQEQIVNRVAKRVAARLVKENRKAKLTDELTQRIFMRLTKK